MLINICLIGLMLYQIILLLRNKMVWKFKNNLLDKVSEAANVDIQNGRDWQWRYDMLEYSTYNKMVSHFWKPLKIKYFYPNDDFINPEVSIDKSSDESNWKVNL